MPDPQEEKEQQDATPTKATSTAQTEAAKALVSAVVRAFYDVKAVVVVDFLLDAKFLRDGPGMGDALQLRTQQLKETLAFLKQEHLVGLECVEGRVETRDANRGTYRRTERANFWYLDLNQAVHTIQLRLKKIQAKLQEDIDKAANSNDTEAKKKAEDVLKRFQDQMSPKTDENGNQVRPGIYELVAQVDQLTDKLKEPVTSNLPSSNGAQDVLIGQVLYDTTNFNTEAAEEFSNAIFVTGMDGQKMVLDLELGTGMQADYRAREDSTPATTVEPSKEIEKPTNDRTISMDALAPIPKPKRVCRNTTPYFLKEQVKKPANSRNSSIGSLPKPKALTENSVDDLTNATRQLSIDLDILEEDEMKANAAASLDQDTSILWQSTNASPDRASVQQFVQQVVKTHKMNQHRRTSSFPPHNLSSAPSCTFESMDASSIFSSLDWVQSGDHNNNNKSAADKKPVTIPRRNETLLGMDSVHTAKHNGQQQLASNASILKSWGTIDAGPLQWQSMDMDSFMMSSSSNKPSPITNNNSMRMMSTASMSLGSTTSNFKSADLMDSILPNLQSTDGNFGTSIRNMLQSMDGTSFNNLVQEAQQPPLEAFMSHLKSLDAFAMNKGAFGTTDTFSGGNNNNNNNNNNRRPSLGAMLASSQMMFNTADNKTALDNLQIFKSADYWENVFASKDVPDLGLAWQQSKPKPVNNRSASTDLLNSYRSGDYLASRDWIGGIGAPEQGEAFDGSIFQSTFEGDKKPAASKQPQKANSSDRYMKMYREKLSGASSASSPPQAAGILSTGWPSSTPTNAVSAASLFPPLPDKMPPVAATMPSSSSPFVASNKPKIKPVSATASKPTKKKGNRVPAVKHFVEYTDLDVLCQRGTKSRLHPGNKEYRSLVESKKPEYRALTDKYLKTKFAEDLMKHIQGYGGRFLEKDKATGKWYIIPDPVARKKVGQALRDDNTPESREEKRRKYGNTSKKDKEKE